jgi:para-aminobenzoate synthetase component 1
MLRQVERAADAVLVKELDWQEPAEAFLRWADQPVVAFLDSAAPMGVRSRFSYLAVEPFQVLLSVDGRTLRDGQPLSLDPFAALAGALAAHRLRAGAAPVPFPGGAVGFLGYELGGVVERLPRRHPNDLRIPEMAIGLYDTVVAFDRATRRAFLLSSGLPAPDGPLRRRRAAARAEQLLDRLAAPARPVLARPVSAPPLGAWTEELPRAEYERRVARVLDYIRAGDIFQANFTGRHLLPRPPGLAAADLFLALRGASPQPFAAYLGCGERLAIASASPERFLRLEPDGSVEARPIKGTRPRGVSPEHDFALRRELSLNEKDRAENLMIVDLMRNDIGRVAEIGSVSVPALCAVESFANVLHLVSSVRGRLRPGLGPVDLLRATFPGGSVTGAPKIRAMEVIDELEAARRGPYCGAIAWIGFDGAMDSSIVIRTLTITPEMIVAQAGGGIVADSDPADEYEEMRVKARPMLRLFDPAA